MITIGYFKGGVRYTRPGFCIWFPIWVPVVIAGAVVLWLLWEALQDWTCCGMAVF
jgi:hypothetical protein